MASLKAKIRKALYFGGMGAIGLALTLALAYSCMGCVASAVKPVTLQGPSDLEVPLQFMVDHTVEVTARCVDGVSGGSGVIISPQLIVTAYHVGADRDCHYSVENHLGSRYVVLRETRAEWDLAFLTIAAKYDVEPLKLAHPAVGTRVHTTAYPVDRVTHNQRLTYSTGHVMGNPYRSTGQVRVSSAFLQGASGGPCFDSKGRLLGIINSVMGMRILGSPMIPLDSHYYIVGSQYLQKALDRQGVR